MRKNLPYLEEDESCAVNGTGPEDGCLVERDITLGANRLDVVLELLFILNEDTVLVGAALIKLKKIFDFVKYLDALY